MKEIIIAVKEISKLDYIESEYELKKSDTDIQLINRKTRDIITFPICNVLYYIIRDVEVETE